MLDIWKNTPWHFCNSNTFAHNHTAWIPGSRSFKAFFTELNHKNPTPPPKLNQTFGKLWNLNWKEGPFPKHETSTPKPLCNSKTITLMWQQTSKGLFALNTDYTMNAEWVELELHLKYQTHNFNNADRNCHTDWLWGQHKLSCESTVLKEWGLFTGHWHCSTQIS